MQKARKGILSKGKRIVVVLLLLLMAIGCQPTPAEDAVRQKNDHRLLELGKKDPGEQRSLREQVGAPTTYACEIGDADGAFQVRINAEVEIPDGTKIPIVQVEPVDFTQEQVSAFFRYFCGDREMYNHPLSGSITKSAAESIIQYLTQEIAKMEETGKGDEPYAEECRQELAYYQSIYKDAPENDTPERCDGTLQTVTEYSPISHKSVTSYTALIAQESDKEYQTKGYVVQFSVSNRNDLKHATQVDGQWFTKKSEALLTYINGRNSANGEQSEHSRITDLDVSVPLSLSPRDALEKTREFLSETGMEEHFIVDSITLYHNPGIDPNLHNWEEYSYGIRLTRTVQNIPCAYSSIPVLSEYGECWQYEQLLLFIDDDGIFLFHWFSPMRITETLLPETKLLPFSKIMELFKVYVRQSLLPDAENGTKANFLTYQKYTIDRITLSLQRIQIADDFDHAMLVPVWSFYGTLDEQTPDETLTNWELPQSLVTINAIDGTIIDLTKGY